VDQIIHPPFILPPLPTVKRILNPRVGDKVLEGDNRFQQDLLLGSKLVHQPNDDYILLGRDEYYRKNVRKELPVCGDGSELGPGGVGWTRGMRRWTALPDVVEVYVLCSVFFIRQPKQDNSASYPQWADKIAWVHWWMVSLVCMIHMSANLHFVQCMRFSYCC